MNLNQLEYFCTAVRCESITQAAKRLYVSQPAISGAIRELEKEFSVNLFVHARNKLVLTEDGRRFYERAALLLQEVETATHQLKELGTGESRLRVGVPPLWGTIFFPDLIHDFARQHPNIHLTFYEYGSSRAASLVQEEVLDVALVNMGHVNPMRLDSVCIGSDHFVLAVDPAHPLAARKTITLQDLNGVPLIMYNNDSVQNFSVSSRFEELGIAPDIQLYTSQILTMKSMVHAGRCASFFYYSLLQDHPDLKGIELDPPIVQQVGLIWQKRKYTPESIECFISFVKEYPLFPQEFK